MAIVADDGLLLRSLRYRETSRIVTFLTREHGKVHLIAKAARDAKSQFGCALDAPARTRLIFYLKKNRDLHLLKSAWVETVHLRVLASVPAYHVACAGAEFTAKVVPDEAPCPDVFALLERLLGECEARAAAWETLDPRAAVARASARLKAFQLQVIAAIGYAPQLAACARCGADAETPGGFGVSEGGVLCSRCARRSGEVLSITPGCLQRLRVLLAENSHADSPRMRCNDAGYESAPSSAEREAARIIESFLRYHLPNYQGLRALRSLADWMKLRARHSVANPPSAC